MANSLQRNIDALRAGLADQQKYNETFGSEPDPRIDTVLRYLASDYDMGTWPKPMRDAICVGRADDWSQMLASLMSIMLYAVATGDKPSKEHIASLKHRLARCDLKAA